MSVDLELLEEYTRFVDWEGDPAWHAVPVARTTAKEWGLDAHWTECLSARISPGECVSNLWAAMRPRLPRTLSALAAKTSGLALLRTHTGVSLIYLIGQQEEWQLRRGYSPVRELPPISALFPIDLSRLYQLHDGFVNFMSYDGGPLPAGQWRTVPDLQSGAPSFVKIATDGSEAFGFDVSESPCQSYVLRPASSEVEAVADSWAFLDDLMAGSIEHA